MTEADTARRALPLLDLTDLGDGCTGAAIEALCAAARAGGVALRGHPSAGSASA